MKQIFLCFVVVAASCTAVLECKAATPALPVKVEFNRDVRPIFSDNCFYCHGPDKTHRKAKLRLDVREDALAKEAFVPGKSEASELIKRLFSTDKEQVMPPPDAHKTLSVRDKDILKLWIQQGAEYQLHWSYEKPVKAAIPAGENGVDVLVQKRLAEIGLKPSQEADKHTLIRRLYSDLLGLPPKPDEVAAFLKDTSPKAYENVVERLLANPHYGERMAISWLDVVRFADTIGYHSDNPRNVSPYRDYVIRAFNENKRFDRFTLEQVAGDLLPDSNTEAKVGSAFNRLLLSTEEGGAQPKDYESRMLTDRVRAVGAAWMGQTTGCCQCHDHKFDPISQRDFYALGAFFADIKEPILGRREDGMVVLDAEQQKKSDGIDARLTELRAEFNKPRPELAVAQAEWEKAAEHAITDSTGWDVLKPVTAKSGKTNIKLKSDADGIVRAEIDEKRNARKQNDGTENYTVTVKLPKKGVTGFRIDALKEKATHIGFAGNGNFVLSEVSISDLQKAPVKIAHASATYEQETLNASKAIDGILDQKANGWSVLGGNGTDQSLYLELTEATAAPDATFTFLLTFNAGDNQAIRNLRISATTAAAPIRAPATALPAKDVIAVLKVAKEKRNAAQQTTLANAFKQITPTLNDLRTKISVAEKERTDFDKSAPKCLVTISTPQKRTVKILARGNWMDETGEVVKAALPHYLPQPKIEGREATRLDLAQWLVSKENPLTARTVMNRMWKQFFGMGLSKVLDDLGAQGEPPVNPALLDWLACEFVDSGWDFKHMVRTVVSSRTYKQVSTASKDLVLADPYNRELARQSRFRIDAELVRDNALAVSGLLVPKIGGPSVKPYQPERYWENLNFPTREYQNDSGESQYRRGLYTWWQRSFLHPSMAAFDAPSREESCADRNRSNIPQQALVLLNDPTYVEAARALASRILSESKGATDERIKWAFQQVLQRDPTADEAKTVATLFDKQLADYNKDPKEAESLLRTGIAPVSAALNKSELAAWTHVARVLLNLHETITRS
ncbi:MAG: PSD1 and planctomycete cytochrome C domain-containing protein [Planctomycetota bacterium]